MDELTNIIGYFNPNKFPVSLNSPKIGVVTLVPAGKYLVDRTGVKINDPRLDQFVGPGRLSRETSKTTVPVRRIGTPPQAAPQTGSPVSVLQTQPKFVEQDTRANAVTPITRVNGNVVIRGGSGVAIANSDSSRSSRPVVTACSIAEAEAKGYLGRARPAPDNLDKLSAIGANSRPVQAANRGLIMPEPTPTPTSEFESLLNPQPDPELAALDAAGVMPKPIKPAMIESVTVSPSINLPDPVVADEPAPAREPAKTKHPRGVPTTFANMEKGTPVMVMAGGKLTVGQYIAFSEKYGMPEVMVGGKKVVRKVLRAATEQDVTDARNAAAPPQPSAV